MDIFGRHDLSLDILCTSPYRRSSCWQGILCSEGGGPPSQRYAIAKILRVRVMVKVRDRVHGSFRVSQGIVGHLGFSS